MLGKATNYLYQTVRYIRSSVSSFESSKHRRSNDQHKSINLLKSNQKSIESINLSSESSIESEMANVIKYDQMCKKFEIRIENSVKLTKDKKVSVKSNETKETIVIEDDEIEEVFTNLVVKNETKKKQTKLKQLKLFANVTNKIQNVNHVKENEKIKSPIKPSIKLEPIQLKSTINCSALNSIENELPLNEEQSIENEPLVSESTLSKDEQKKKFSNLKPENYRIQQVIKEDDLVFFDLETGGMSSKSDILQIGAVNHENKQFNMYATPTQPIAGLASRVHHITFKDNQMCYRKHPVKHHSILEVLLKFCDYLDQTKSNNIVLVAHNANFDRRFLIEKIFLYNLQSRLNGKIVGFLDTLPMFRSILPAQPTYKQDKLVLSYFPNTKTDFHNALTDVIYLKKLFQKVALNRMRNEYKFINGFSQNLEFAYMKKEQLMFEEMCKKRPAKKSGENRPAKKRKTSSIFINGEPMKLVKRSTRKSTQKSTQKSTEPRRTSRRLNKK